VNIREDRASGKQKGFAFVTFESEESALRAIASMNNHNYGGRCLTVSKATIRGSDNNGEGNGADNSWKTVPIPAPSARGKSGKAAAGGKPGASGQAKPRATWDHWAGPVAKPATTVAGTSTTETAKPKAAPAATQFEAPK
jgi:RNA recognition motif-containing protein